jgi:hypothetical protein
VRILLSVHLSHIQEAHCLQHLQHNKSNKCLQSKLQWLVKHFPPVDVNTLKCSNLFISSLSINSWISLILTLARFKSSIEDNVFVRGFCNGILCSCSLSYSDNKLYPLELVAIHLLANYSVPRWIKRTKYYVWNTLYIEVVSTIFHGSVGLTGISQIHTIQ